MDFEIDLDSYFIPKDAEQIIQRIDNRLQSQDSLKELDYYYYY